LAAAFASRSIEGDKRSEGRPALQTIVVGYDDGEPAKRALERAVQLAKAFGGQVLVTSVARALVPAAHGLGPVDPVDPLAEHDEQLRHAAAFLAEHGVQGEFETGLGEPAHEILRIAKERDADLIVVGTREPGLISHVLGLSVSGAIQRRAHCDVLIVH
jgi:nucleotide-binding universal stress UspA family protein